MFGYDSGELVGQGVAVVNAADETSPQETADTIIHSLNETGTWSGEVHNVKKDGDRFWCHAVVSTLDHPEFGRVWVALHEDVTEHKQAEEALRAESERNQRILAGAMDGFVTLDLNGRFCDVNAAYCAIVGYSRDELLGMSIQDVEVQETAEETAQHIEMVLKTGHDRFESKMRRNDGRLIDVEVSANLIDIGGNAQICSFIRDVTERKCAEQTLQESEKRYRNLFHQAPISLWEEDFSALATWFDELRETGVGDLREYLQDHPAAVQKAARLIRVVDVNEGTLRLFGVESMAELLSTSLKAVEEQRGSAFSNQAFAEQLIAIWEGQRRFETEFAASTPEGAHIDCLLQWVAPPQAPGKLDLSYVIIAISDITERKRAEEKLRESDARFRAIFEGAGIGMALADMDGRLVESNATFQQMLGYDAQELRGMVFTDFTHPEDAAVDMALYKELEARKRHHYQIEKRYIRKDGQLVYGQLTVSLVHGNGAKPQFAIGMVQDITAHKKAEEALRDSEIRFRTTFESAAIPMVLGDVHGGFIETNPAFRKLFGYSAEELAELKFNDITHPKDIERGWDLFKQLVAGTISTLQIEKRYIRKDGSVILANTSASAIHDSQGRLLHTVAMVQDITARKLAEEALRASESRFRGLLEAEPDGVVVVDEAGRIDLVNTKAAKMFGYRREELFGEPIELVVPQGLFKKHVGHRARFLEQPQARPMGTELEVTGRRKDGSEFPADVSLSPLETDQGLFVMSIVRDITERKRTELALRESEERFRVIFESAPFGMAVVDVAGTHARYNRAFQEMLGYTEQELQERDVAEYTHPEDIEDTRRLFSELREGKRDLYQLEKRYVRKDGRIVWGSLAFTSVRDAQGDVQYLIATVKDITEGKQAEAALRESEERLALALDATSEGLWDWNIATGEMFYSPQWCKALGYDPSDVEPYGKFWEGLVHPNDLARFYEVLNAHFEQKTDLFECEVRLRTKSGEYRWNLDRGKVVARDEDGKPVRMVGVDVDITERKRAEEALRESEVKYRELFESASDVICLMNNEGNIVDINRRGELVTGYSRAELCQMNVLDQLVVPEDHAVCKEVIERAAPEAEYVYEVRWRTKQGKIVHFEGASTYRFSASGELMTTRCTLRDITERKRAEEQARQLQADLAHMSRLSSMGEMATGLAHELNQPLTVITNYAQGCVRRLKSNAIDPEELGDILGRIATQAQRSSSIIRGLGNLVRKSSALRFEIDINHCIMEVADLANAEATQHRAKARFELEPNLPLVMADQTQLQQVILNLVQNGCEAIGDTPESRRAVTVRTKQRGDRELEISVSDNGRGISEPLGERLFEPFFTTKAQGIGMGLAISRSIVESHGGRLWATPNRGEGTTFHFTLPIVGGHSGDE